MEGFDAVISFVSGVVFRFGIPAIVTTLVVWLLRRLDKRWQKDAQKQGMVQVRAKNPGCWKINECPEENRVKCKAFNNPNMPCWHHFRDQEGRLRESCLGCDVFQKAPVPIAI